MLQKSSGALTCAGKMFGLASAWDRLGSAVPVTIPHTAPQSHTRGTHTLSARSTDTGTCVMSNDCLLGEQREEALQHSAAHCLYFLHNIRRAAFHLFLKHVCICVRSCSDARWGCVIVTSMRPSSSVTRVGLPGNRRLGLGGKGKPSPVAV